MNRLLCEAIRNKNLITFNYDGGERTVEPHCYGVSKDGKELLRAYQIAGHSESGNPAGWKLFRLDGLTDLHVSNDTFDRPRPQYNPEDRVMAEVYCCL